MNVYCLLLYLSTELFYSIIFFSSIQYHPQRPNMESIFFISSIKVPPFLILQTDRFLLCFLHWPCVCEAESLSPQSKSSIFYFPPGTLTEAVRLKRCLQHEQNRPPSLETKRERKPCNAVKDQRKAFHLIVLSAPWPWGYEVRSQSFLPIIPSVTLHAAVCFIHKRCPSHLRRMISYSLQICQFLAYKSIIVHH